MSQSLKTPEDVSIYRPPKEKPSSQDLSSQKGKKPPSLASSQVPHSQTPKSSLLFGERLAPVGREDASDAPAPPQLVATPMQSTSLDPSARLLSNFKSKPSDLKDAQSPQSVATESSGEMVFAHKSGDMYGDQPHCISHMTNTPPPNTGIYYRNLLCIYIWTDLHMYRYIQCLVYLYKYNTAHTYYTYIHIKIYVQMASGDHPLVSDEAPHDQACGT